MEAPRGGLSHWIVIEDDKITNYQAVVPSTWNAGPSDPTGRRAVRSGAQDAHVMHDPKQPLEILRTCRPVHGLRRPREEPDGEELVQVAIR